MANPEIPFSQRFAFLGVDLSNPPDAVKPGKLAAAQNIRGNPAGSSVFTRPGSTRIFTTSNNAVTDMRAFAALGTDDKPRFLARDSLNKIWGDTNNASPVLTLAGNNGYGAAMLPFRPGASSQSYMYVAGLGDYQKISAPDANNNYTTAKVGIAEPHNQVEAAAQAPAVTSWDTTANNWTAGGNAANATDGNRSTDTLGSILADPVIATRYSIQVGNNVAYQKGELVKFIAANASVLATVPLQDVIPPLAPGNVFTISAILYDAGNNGNCTIVPTQLPLPGNSQMAYLRRGSLMKIANANNNEVVFIQSASPGPSGALSVRTSTVATYANNANLAGIPAIIADAANLNLATTANSVMISSNFTGSNNNVGNGTLTLTPAVNPFATQLGSSGSLPQQDDYIHVSVLVSDYTLVQEIKIMFNVDASDNTFTQNVLYFSIRQADLAPVATGASTQISAIQSGTVNAQAQSQITNLQGQIDAILNSGTAAFPQGIDLVAGLTAQLQQLQNIASGPNQTASGSSQWTEIFIPISSLTRIGNDQSRSLINTTSIRVYASVTGNVTINLSSQWVGGGAMPDVGDTGAAYSYRVVPRNSTTGAMGNPSPMMRYGVSPRRQKVTVVPPSNAYDSQIDVWDIYRYGGSVTSFRYAGTVTAGNNFTDNFFDDAVRAGDLMQTDNFEPWPSIDVPFTVVSGGGNSITLYGTRVSVVVASAGLWPSTIASWLPGTLVQIDNQQTYTLRARPTLITSTNYLFEMLEAAGSGSATKFWVNEPIVARQPVPYTWGPDEAGTAFAVGDTLRPGTIYFSKSNNPDSAPDTYNLELCPPSEPLLGGGLMGGISFVGSTQRWWVLSPSFGGQQRYVATERPIGKAMVSPYGIAVGAGRIFFWARDCIAFTSGGAAESLTDADLYPIFPHDGVAGVNVVRNLNTFYAPDYSRAAQFRLAYTGGYLYATYPDSAGTYRTMVMDIRTGGWQSDAYNTALSGAYSVEQQEGSLTGANNNAYALFLMGLVNGNVDKQTPLTNDNVNNNSNGTGITWGVQTCEWDGGQQSVNGLWRDVYVDARAPNGYNATPVSLNANASNTTTVAANTNRQFQQIQVNNGTIERFMGVMITGTDTF